MPYLVLLLALVLFAVPAWGQADGRTLEAAKVGAGEGIRVDGVLDESVWAAAPVADGFVQSEPTPGAAASEPTEVRVAFDDDALYVGVRAYVGDRSRLVRRLVRRDEFGDLSDRVFVEVGSPADGRTAFSFGVNLAGSRQDVLLTDDRNTGDYTWDAVWDSAVREFDGADGAGYVVEVRVPFSQLRYDPANGRAWQFNVQRDIPTTGERTFWSPILPDADGYVSQFGTLVGLAGLRAPRRAEVVPYAATRLTQAPGSASNPFYSENDVSPQVGLDARFGVTSGLTLTATVNPDFGQVEADPAVVNLSQFEVRFDERRPFFIEGTDVFEFGGTRGRAATERPEFFYSRRIGAEPYTCDVWWEEAACQRGAAERGAFLDGPRQTPIAAAAKLSGQAGAWTVGVLDAVTSEESARFFTPETGEAQRQVAPLTNYFVGRAQRNWRGGRAVAGGFVSSMLRDTREAAFGPVLPTSATVGGVDFEAATASRAWTLSGVAAGSAVTGDPTIITWLQQAEQRYYQRPDAGYLSVDPDATSLAGYRAEVALAKTGGGPNWRGSLTLGATSPGFEVNDLGFQERADLLSADWEVRYNAPRPRAPFLNYATVFAYGAQGLNYGGQNVLQNVNLGVFTRFSNLWGAQVIGTVRPTYLNDRLTRGGVVAERPADYSVSTWVGSNGAKRLSGSLAVAGRREFAHDYANVGTEWTVTVRPRVYWRPTDALTLSAEPDWVRAYNTDQYRGRAAVEGSGPGAIGGVQYLFTDVRIETVDLGLRADWAFSPDLTAQLFVEPQVSAIRFDGLRALAEAGSYDFAPYEGSAETFGDYTRLSLRGNAVLRWEWRPGSTLYAVWQRVRDDYGAFGGLDVLEDVGDVFGGDATNVFLLKANYWFGL